MSESVQGSIVIHDFLLIEPGIEYVPTGQGMHWPEYYDADEDSL
jgi:hypothetical protein